MNRLKTQHKLSPQMRELTWKVIEEVFGQAPVWAVKYGEDCAVAWCQWQDGVREYMSVDYEELDYVDSQHYRAMQEIRKVM